MRVNEPITDREIDVPDGEPLVSRTDTAGRIVFANKVFLDVSGFTHEELIGAPHNIVRHPHMPEAAFADLWATIKAGVPWEGLVKNRSKNGDFYWVRANVTPVVQERAVTGYISIRSKPTRQQIDQAEAAYAMLRGGNAGVFGLRNGRLVRRGWHEGCRVALTSVTGRLMITLGIALLAIIVAGWVGLNAMTASNKALEEVYAQGAQQTARIGEVRDGMLDDLQQLALLTREPEDAATVVPLDRIAILQTSANRIDPPGSATIAGASTPEQQAVAAKYIENRTAFVRDALVPAIALAQRGDAPALHAHFYHQVLPLFARAEAASSKLVALQFLRAETTFASARDDLHSRFQRELAVMLACCAAVVALTALVLRTIHQPLRRLETSSEAISRDDLAHDIEIPSQREFWQLAGLLRAIRAKLTYVQHERAENERLAAIDRREAVQDMADTVEREAGQAVERVAADTDEMAQKADAVAELTERVSNNALGVSAAADQALANAQAVGAASGELSAAIQEIAGQIARSTQISKSAVHSAERAQEGIQALSQAAVRIGDVVGLIRTIAKQTNLLALNATIEAARAGPAGRGFTIVASEVKGLASQTALSTEEISRQIAAIQDATGEAVAVVEAVGQAIEEISQVTTGIAAAVEEQAAATRDIAHNVAQGSIAMQHVAERITDVSRDAAVTRESAHGIRDGSVAVADSISALRSSIIRTIRTASNEADRRIEHRISTDQPCVVEFNGTRHRARLLDISHAGGRLMLQERMPVGGRGTLFLDTRQSDLGTSTTASFAVRSSHPDGSIGVAFEENGLSPGFAHALALLIGAEAQHAA
jgi:PAS domain S-box-containing protein